MTPLFVLGGAQTDFARNFARDGASLFDVMRAATAAALTDAGLDWADIETVHVGNFTAELFAHQGQLGGFFPSMHEDLIGVPSARHEAACASGSVALLAACSELQAGHYDVALVLGVEQMRNVDGATAAAHLGVAAFHGQEAQGARFVWPSLFSELAGFYAERFGVGPEAGLAWSARMFANAAQNPLAQTRAWAFPEGSFTLDDQRNPIVDAPLRRFDCGQITDGVAAVVVVSERFLTKLGARDGVAALRGFGHRTAPMSLAEKLRRAPGSGLPFPEVARTVRQARERAGWDAEKPVDVVELHDCFSITALMLLHHLGLARVPSELGRRIADGEFSGEGSCVVNSSGGLIGLGHPVGATGVRMVLDAARQVTDRAGKTQVRGARRAQTLNIGGSATTTVSFVVEAVTSRQLS
jgi:acetyl-CoA C-acetyltransferase